MEASFTPPSSPDPEQWGVVVLRRLNSVAHSLCSLKTFFSRMRHRSSFPLAASCIKNQRQLLCVSLDLFSSGPRLG
jgi:hypothetical protein